MKVVKVVNEVGIILNREVRNKLAERFFYSLECPAGDCGGTIPVPLFTTNFEKEGGSN